MSHGKGQMPHPDSDYQSPRLGIPGILTETPIQDKRDVPMRLMAEKRSDPTSDAEAIYPDLLYAKGNPDLFGPGPAQVQEGAQRPPAQFRQPKLRYGVDRQG